MDRIDEIVRELNQELIETRNLTIKTDNSVRNLAGDVKQIIRAQESFERRMVLNSVGAYVLFAVLSFAGLFLVFRASSTRARVDKQLYEERESAFVLRVEELEADLDRRRTAEGEAYDFYELLVAGHREEVVERFAEVQGQIVDRATIELFRREVDRIRQELGSEAYTLGMQKMADSRWQEARDAFQRSIAYIEFASFSPQLHFSLAECLFNLDDHIGAVRYYNAAIESGNLGRADQVLAYFHRAEALQETGRMREALEAYRVFSNRFSNHPWSASADARAARILMRLEGQ